MRSLTNRLIIVIASLLIAAIISIQVHWLNKTYAFEKKEFTTSVLKAIRGVYEDLPLLYNYTTPLDSLVETRNESSFGFRIDTLPDPDSIRHYMAAELEDFSVFTDCKMGVYDTRKKSFVYQAYLSGDGSRKDEKKNDALSIQQKSYSYVLLHFPDRHKYIIRQMRTWILTSVMLLLLLVGFSFAIYYFMRQKFLVEIQKDFINNVTHEFSTPLSVIELSLEGLEKKDILSNPEKHHKFITSIRYQSDYLKSHITNLVKTVVAGHYQLVFLREPVTPNELVKRAVTQLEPLLQKKSGRMIWQLEPGNTVIAGDEENLYLAFFNIISNAIKYAQHPVVTISTRVSGNNYIVSIKDNGPGIEPSQQTKIFRKFYRAGGGNIHNVKGLGLGLYFTKKVIDGHRGQIRVHSVPGNGAEFIIQLPLNTANNGNERKDIISGR